MIIIKQDNVMYYRSIYYAFILAIFGILGYLFLDSGFSTKTRVKVEYEDKSDIYYKVNYIDNDYSSSSDRYVSNLVDNIEIFYDYENIISEYIVGYYRYSVDATLVTYENESEETLWERDYKLVDENTVLINAKNINNIKINDSFIVDFSRFREEVNNFIDNLDVDLDLYGYLQIKINIFEALKFESFDNEYEDSKSMVVNIPLSQDTFKIDVKNINNKNNCYEFVSNKTMNIVFIIIGVFCVSVSLALLVLVIRQFKVISENQNEYKKKLNKILTKYDSNIVKIKRFYVNKKYNMIYVASFKELMDVSDKKNKMISFKETKRDSESVFVIIDDNDAWIYKLIANNEK